MICGKTRGLFDAVVSRAAIVLARLVAFEHNTAALLSLHKGA